MKIIPSEIPAVKLVHFERRGDHRGSFAETYRRDVFLEAGITDTFVQDNHSTSPLVGTVRGLHFQVPPHGQAKLVRVVRGAIFDVAVDLRVGAPTYGRHVAVKLSAAACNELYIPKGFAHGFCTLEPETEVVYKVDAYYAPTSDRGIRWDDPELAIPWPVDPSRAVVSQRDLGHPNLLQFESPFVYAPPA